MNQKPIRLKEISKSYGMCTTTLRRMIKRGELKAVLIGNVYYVMPEDFDEFIFNLECKKLGVSPHIIKAQYERERKKRLEVQAMRLKKERQLRIDLINSLGLDDNIKKILLSSEEVDYDKL